jgi:hypothetical protein
LGDGVAQGGDVVAVVKRQAGQVEHGILGLSEPVKNKLRNHIFN